MANPSAPAAGDSTPFEYDFHVRYSEVDHRGLMTLPAVVDAFQDCSTFQSEMLGVGVEWLRAERRAWVLTHWHIVVDRRPELCERVTVGTFASSFRGISAKRNFYLRDASGDLAARADSSWALLDLETGRPCRPDARHTEPYGTHAPLEMPDEARRVAVPDGMEPRDALPVRPGQIDMNEHVNNAQYVQMALELLGREADADARVLRVDYRRAAVLGDVIHPTVAREPGRSVVTLRDDDGSPFAVVELS